MKFTTKKYTLNLLISEVQSLTPSQVSSFSSLKKALSPRVPVSAVSAKIYTLNRFLNGNLNSIVSGSGKYSSYGKTAKSRILFALRNRKTSKVG